MADTPRARRQRRAILSLMKAWNVLEWEDLSAEGWMAFRGLFQTLNASVARGHQKKRKKKNA